MKFSEYLASQITPQMTLLEKFNAMCKFLEEHENGFGTKLYQHFLRLNNGVNLTLINRNPNKETSLNYSIFSKSVSVRCMVFQEVIYWTMNQQGENIIATYNGTTIYERNIGKVIIDDEVSEL